MEKKFYWGNSVSSMQTEGAWNEGGKGMSVYDIREAGEFSSDWKVAIDSYHRYEEDFDLMKDLGMNMYRFQISWSRVNPDGDGEWNEEGIAFYHTFIDNLLERGIEPMICLYHYDMPLNLAQKYNGFIDKYVVKAFARFGIEMIKRFGNKVKYWLTFNEQNVYHMATHAFGSSGYLEGEQTEDELYKIQHNIMMAHTYVTNYIHEHTDCKIGGMITYSEIYPETCHPKDVYYARVWQEFINYNLLDAFTKGEYSSQVMQYVKNKKIDMGITPEEDKEFSKMYCDFIAFSYYASQAISHKNIPEDPEVGYLLKYGKVDNPFIRGSEWNWKIDELGFRDALNNVYQRYQLPVFPVENGIGVIEEWDGENPIDDTYRIEYHRNHIMAMQDAIKEDGIEVMGYLAWGMIDILSSIGDMRKRYGVVFVNRDNHDLRDLQRIPKKSYNWLKKAYTSNGENLDK